GLKSVSSPAIRVSRGPIIKRIVIDVSVVSVEAVVAGIGAAVAPITAVPAGACMAFAIDRTEICRRQRSAGAAENGGGNCCRNKKTLHGDNRAYKQRRPKSTAMFNAMSHQVFGQCKSKQPRWLSIKCRPRKYAFLPAECCSAVSFAGSTSARGRRFADMRGGARNCESLSRRRCVQGCDSGK